MTRPQFALLASASYIGSLFTHSMFVRGCASGAMLYGLAWRIDEWRHERARRRERVV